MVQFRRVTDTFYVAPQIDLADLARAKAEGFTLVINNRPDDEAPGQPCCADIAEAARGLGLDYLPVPVFGGPGPQQVMAVRTAVAGSAKTLAFCRSGTRSIFTWAMGQATPENRVEIARLGAAAGYDLSPVLGL
jgi:uncharacterized protein (TIGR01244 family)